MAMPLLTDAFAGGYKSAIDMSHASQDATSESQLLSDKAQSANLAVQQQKEDYAAKMGARATEAQVQKANADLNTSTSQGRMSLLQKSLLSTKDPIQQEYIRGQIKDASNENALNLSNQAKATEAQSTVTFDAVSQALISRDPKYWDMAIESADDKTKQVLTQVKQIHMSDEYKNSSPAQQRVLDKQILMGIAPEKAAATMLNQQAMQQYRETQLQIRQESNDIRRSDIQQREALKQQGDAMKAEASAMRRDAELTKIDSQLRLGEYKPMVDNPDYSAIPFTKGHDLPAQIPNPDPVYQDLIQRQNRLQKQQDKADGIQSPTGKGKSMLPEGITLSPGIHTDKKSGDQIQVYEDGSYDDIPKKGK